MRIGTDVHLFEPVDGFDGVLLCLVLTEGTAAAGRDFDVEHFAVLLTDTVCCGHENSDACCGDDHGDVCCGCEHGRVCSCHSASCDRLLDHFSGCRFI